MASQNTDSDLNLINVYNIITKNWKLIFTACLITGVIAAVILLLMPNTYKNSTIFFPVSEQIVDKTSILNETTYNEATIFAPENIVDRVYNMSISPAVQEYVIHKNNLVEHYGYDKDSKNAAKKTAKKYGKNIKLIRTPYNSIELTVTDVDYKKAAVIAQDVLDKTEDIYHSFFRNARNLLISNIENQIVYKDSLISIWSDSLAQLRDQYRFYGVISPHHSQATIPSTGSINGKGFENIQNLEEAKEKALIDVSTMRSNISEIRLMVADNQYFLNLVQKPQAYQDKAGPQRTLILLLVLILTFFGTVIMLLISQQTKGTSTSEQ